MHFDCETEASRARYSYTTSIIRLSLNGRVLRVYVGDRRRDTRVCLEAFPAILVNDRVNNSNK